MCSMLLHTENEINNTTKNDMDNFQQSDSSNDDEKPDKIKDISAAIM